MIKTITKTTYINDEGFSFTFEPIEGSLGIKKTKIGFEAKYLTPDNDPIDPREDENYSTMVCFHKNYKLGDETDLKSEDFNGWEELEKHLIEELKAVVVLPLYLYDHSGISMRTYRHGQHKDWDCGQVGFIYMTADDIREVGIKKSKAEQYLINEVETYNQYLTGDLYCIVKETYDQNKERIDYDVCGGYFGYEYAVKALETDI